ncbi:MAG: hypothetical protein IKK39_10830 [Thermoguttaceae bacterium]|nr:hypothetical protein [Thermoguttaceae bacterium]
MRIAYYLNDGTRKIGNTEEFRRDYDAGNVDASRQAAIEVKSKIHAGFAARTLAHEELRDGEREERKRDDRRQLAYRLLRVVAVGFFVATPAALRRFDELPEPLFVFLVGVSLWLVTALMKTSVNLSRLARIGRFKLLGLEKAYQICKEEREFTSEEKKLLVDYLLYPWKYERRAPRR